MGPDPAVASVRRAVRLALARLADESPDGPFDQPVGRPPDASSIGSLTGPPEARPGDPELPLLVAMSGGPDSVALAAATAFVADRDSLCAGAVIVDHGLQDGSDVVAARAAALAYELGLDPVRIVRVDVATGPASGGPEGAARAARYRALDDTAAAVNALVLLGHTRDDQAETVLLGLGRGSGPRSIAGMRRREGRYLRPFLDVDRATTVQACAALGLPVWHDPHNLDPSFRRVRLRREVLPLLEDVLGGGVAAALARTADLLRVDVDALDRLAHASSARQDRGPLDIGELEREPEALRARVLQGWAAAQGAGPLTAAHVAALTALVTPAGVSPDHPSPADGREGRQAHLPGGYVAVRRSGRLQMHRIEVHSDSHRPS